MKIVHLISGLKIGGAESALLNFLSKVVNDEDEHLVICFHHGVNVEKIERIGFRVYQVRGFFFRYDIVCFLRLKKLIKTLNPAIIHTACWSANIFGRIVGYQLKIPVICDIHGNSFDEGWFRNWLDRLTVGVPEKFIAVSDGARDSFLQNIINKVKSKKLLATRLVTIKNGVDFEAVYKTAEQNKLMRQTFGLDVHDFVIGAVGRLEPIKSYDILLRAFALFKARLLCDNVKLCIVGDGSQRDYLRQLSKQLNIETAVVFVGERSDAVCFYPLFDCFALSSQSEGLSIALLEAMCFGLPIVTTHKTKIHDIIVDGINGFLVEPCDLSGMIEVFEKLYSDKNIALKIRSENKMLVCTVFNLDSVVAQYKKIYSEINSSKSGSIGV
jgi:glycosyltransferase involved in cell wall biosynthesis